MPSVTIDELSKPENGQYLDSLMLEIIYTVSRSNLFCMDKSNALSVPSWKQFHSVNIRNWTDSVKCSIQSYHNGTQNRCWYSLHFTLLRLKETAGMLGQEHIAVFFDMG